MDTSVKVAHILLDAGCDVSQTTSVGKTPVSLALEQVSGITMTFVSNSSNPLPARLE
jgi:hypothetical protein